MRWRICFDAGDELRDAQADLLADRGAGRELRFVRITVERMDERPHRYELRAVRRLDAVSVTGSDHQPGQLRLPA